MTDLLIILLSYFLGSFPTALIVVKLFTGRDVRSSGSGNMGALNTLRMVGKYRNKTLGLLAFVIVTIVDMGKAVLAVYLAQFFFLQNNTLGITLATFFAILGHNYPVFFKFYGGRGAASLMGIFIYLDGRIFIVWLLSTFIFIVLTELIFNIRLKKKVNLKFFVHAVSEQIIGRLIGEAMALIPIYFINKNLFLPALLGTFLVILRHDKRIVEQLKNYKKII